MSEIMMEVLRMPSDLFWADDAIMRGQHDAIRKEAAYEIEKLRDEVDNLRRRNGQLRRVAGLCPEDATVEPIAQDAEQIRERVIEECAHAIEMANDHGGHGWAGREQAQMMFVLQEHYAGTVRALAYQSADEAKG